ncbi:MAG: class I SAM-dependent RNA methyltransferase [Candidatus Dojkabacteria bacterium]
MTDKCIIHIDYIQEKGFGVGQAKGRTYYVLGALPGEVVTANEFKRKKGISYCSVVEYVTTSINRVEPAEDHYLACSPLQAISFSAENEIKKDLVRTFFREYAETELPDFELVDNAIVFHYRNKVEFSLYGHDESESLSLAFHKREGKKAKYTLEGCKLLPELMNKHSARILHSLQDHHIQARMVKGIVLRYSFTEEKVIAAVYFKDEISDWHTVAGTSLISDELTGLHSIFSTHRSPACVETYKLGMYGDTTLTENVLGKKFTYEYDSFFQINPSLFEEAARDIRKLIEGIPQHQSKRLYDLYGGVGTIGILCSDLVQEVICVESHDKAQRCALKNAKHNQVHNFSFFHAKTEKSQLGSIAAEDIVILDPPRAGLHPKVIKELIACRPEIIIYLSCNPKTLAQDIALLKGKYKLSHIRAYNFYPRTMHCEVLILLEIKS